jgi:hypothetical protein
MTQNDLAVHDGAREANGSAMRAGQGRGGWHRAEDLDQLDAHQAQSIRLWLMRSGLRVPLL